MTCKAQSSRDSLVTESEFGKKSMITGEDEGTAGHAESLSLIWLKSWRVWAHPKIVANNGKVINKGTGCPDWHFWNHHLV